MKNKVLWILLILNTLLTLYNWIAVNSAIRTINQLIEAL